MATEKNTHVIVIGASAGGIDALQQLVRALPDALSAPIVIAQHISPRRTSSLGPILARVSPLPVQSVAKREKLKPGTIYVVPANHDVEIQDGDIVVTRGDDGAPLPSVDLLFSSAARAYGENVIAIVLTGTGNDGAAGARTVKAAGGTVIIQNPETASFPAMPLALAPNTVDIVANLDSIGSLLGDLISGSYPIEAPGEEEQVNGLLTQIRDRSGIDFAAYKHATINRRLRRRMIATGVTTVNDYRAYLQRNPDEYQRLVNSFLIKVTEFFRDPELFNYLRDNVLPNLLDSAEESGELRVWSAGCATGEEAYSLAVLIAELLEARQQNLVVRIFATDVDGDAVAFARQGIYPSSAISHLPEETIRRHFTPTDGSYEVKKHIRAMVIFGQHDLGQRAPFPRIDLVLCRNVLIYFTAELQKRALQLFAFSLRDGGYLVLGKAETVSPLPEFFALEHARLKVFRRIGDRVLIPTARIRASVPIPPPRSISTRLAGGDAAIPRPDRPLLPARSTNERAEAIMLRMPNGIIVVNRRYDIQLINNAGRRLLGIHSSAIGDDLIHLVQRAPLLPLRNAIDAAFRGERSILTFQVDSDDQAATSKVDVELVCYPELVSPASGEPETVVLIATDVSQQAERVRENEQRNLSMRAEAERLTSQLHRATEANHALLAANEELTTVNAELRSSNEEMLIVNEEAQAATEEVETLNEELQASNEELETLNEELQATVEELNTTNDDLQARTIELQDMTITLDEQRRLSELQRDHTQAILDNMSDGVMVVNPAGETILANVAFRTMFGDGGDGFRPEDEVGRIITGDRTLMARVARGEVFVAEFSATNRNGERRWYEASARPMESAHHGDGVIVIRDITERSLRRLQNEFLSLASHELRSPLTSLSGAIQMVRRVANDRLDERGNRYLATAQDQVRQLTALIEDLVDAVRLQTGRFQLRIEDVDLNELAAHAVDAAEASADGQPIVLHRSADDVVVPLDRVRVEQVLMNLLRNALTYAAGSDRIDVRVGRDGDDVTIQVQDYGPGIEETDLSNIFTRFFQVQRPDGNPRAHGGLGLGLFISREIVEAHGGNLSVESSPGDGASFTIRLPARGGVTTRD